MDSEKLNKENRETDEISLKELIGKIREWFHYILSKWGIILLFGVAGGVIGFFVAKTKKAIYTASTTFVLEDGDKGGGGLGQYAGLASMAGIDIGGGAGGGVFQGDNILELYKSRTMIEKALLTEVDSVGKKQLLIDRYIDFTNLRENLIKIPGYDRIDFKPIDPQNEKQLLYSNRLKDSILGVIALNINKTYLSVFKVDKKLSIIKVDVKTPDEFFSKAFNDQIVKNVNDFYVQTKTKKSLETVAILQQKVDSVRAVMNGAIYTASVVLDATPNLNPTRQVQRAAPMQQSQFSAETNKVILGELMKNLELSKMSLRKDAPLIQVIDHPIFPLEKSKLSKLIAIIIGGVVFGFIVVFFFTIKKVFSSILK